MLVYLAALESYDLLPVVEQGYCRSGFFSYYYLKGRQEPETLIKSRPHVENIVIDSGAHSFFAEENSKSLSVSGHRKLTITKETPEEYFNNYLEWAVKYKNYFDYFVELDIGEIVGQEKVLEWRDRIKRAGLYDQCITVMHPATCTWDEYLAMLDDSESRYVALEGNRANAPDIPYGKYIVAAIERKVKVHGFALTSKKVMSKYPFYSVDSSSWKAGVLYGTYTVHKDGASKGLNFKKDKWSLDTSIPGVAEVYNPNLKLQRYKRLQLAAMSYEQLATYYTKLWKAKGVDYSDYEYGKANR